MTSARDQEAPTPAEDSALRRYARRARQRARRQYDALARKRAEARVRANARRWGATAPTPVVPDERTHLGRQMDRIVARLRGNQQPLGIDPDYDLLREHFDHYLFLLQAQDMLEDPDADPIAHFLHNGAKAGNTPDVNFSMRSYLRRNPERARGRERSPYLAWLKEGRAAGEIADPAPGLAAVAGALELPVPTVVDQLVEIRTDLTERLRHGTLGEMIAKAEQIEPQVGAIWPKTVKPTIFPFVAPNTAAMTASIHDLHQQAGFRGARAVIVVNRPRWGGGRRAEGHIAHALARLLSAEEVAVVYTDFSGPTPRDRFPTGVRELDLAAAAERHRLARADQPRVLAEVLRSLDADVVVNINSTLLYETLPLYGKALAQTERIFHVMFCNDRGPRGNWGGHPLKHFYRHVDTAAGVITDSHYLRDWLVDFFCLDDAHVAKLHVFSAPVDTRVRQAPPPPPLEGRRPQVFWAGRIDRQKLPEVVFEVARRMPEADFRMWGEGVAQEREYGEVPANLTLEGAYAGFDELDLSTADVWLYTSAWDGVPSQLLEVGMTGVPVVGSLVGGTGELLGEQESWPVAEIEEPEAYVAALREALADPAAARERAARLRARLLTERTEELYAKQVETVLLAGDTEETSR